MPGLTKPKVFVGTLEIAGIMRGITHCLQARGFEADLHLFRAHEFAYDFPINPNPLFRRFSRLSDALEKALGTPKEAALTAEFNKVQGALFENLLTTYDVFVFNGWNTIFRNYADLPLLKQCGKKVIIFFLGSEGRPQWMQGHCKDMDAQDILQRTEYVFNRVRFLEQYCDCVVSHPPTSQFLSKPFVPLLGIGIPFMAPPVLGERVYADPPIVLHAPTTPLKGTARIQASVDILKAEGFCFDYRELKGQPNSVVLENLAQCSFVVDELYSDSLLAGLGTEAAHFGKATLVGSLPDAADLMRGTDLPPPPCEAFAHGDPLPGMRRLLEDPAYARSLGERAHAYVTSHWSVEQIGERLERLVLGEKSSMELCLPEDIEYFRGWGLSDEDFQSLVTRYIKALGHDALRISNKPRLLLSLLRWLKTH